MLCKPDFRLMMLCSQLLTTMLAGTDEDEDDLGADDDDDEPLNSDDDDESDSEEALQTDNLVLCQYDKVSRTKNKWKAALKYGVSCSPPLPPACLVFASSFASSWPLFASLSPALRLLRADSQRARAKRR
jgi:hypothetical protein